MFTFKLTTVGASEGFIVSKDVQAKLNMQTGDTIYLTEAPGGGLRLTPYSPEFERQMKLAEQIMEDDKEILRVLAK